MTTVEHYRPDFRFSDLVAGYVAKHDPDHGLVEVRTSDGRMVRVEYRDGVQCELLRNLGEPYQDAGGRLGDLLVEGRALFAYGVFSPVGDGYWFEARRMLFLARDDEPYAFEAADWWPGQLAELGRFYRRAQFGDGPVDFADYRTEVRLGGIKKSDRYVQETDTISRMVYGMAAAFMLTGDEDFLEVAQNGSTYLREHMRFVDADDDVVYWYHGIDVRDGVESKLFASEFSDDYRAIPAYEQIYALAGLTQTYRLTGDPRLLADIEGTLRLFATFFHDDERGGWYSHVDPIRLSPHHESLGANRARKNWNSVGDHPPAYLINLFLATGQRRHADMLEECFDLIVERLPDPGSPFVQERFHGDWTPDRTWGWQQDRAVVGHNLKIAWNLTRMNSVRPKAAYRKLADHLGRTMPMVGSDTQRGGWFDVVERQPTEGTGWHRLVWHDRKAWWQQEQAILAYLVLAGCTDDEMFLKHAREAAGFYNAFFLDHDDGGVYFNVLADGVPYLLGTERQKGSHAMSMYHNAELCLLATVYERLLLRREPLELWFRPAADGFGEDRVLRVAPDALPPGRVRLESVEVDGTPWKEFDPAAMAVHLPESDSALTVRVRLRPEG